MPTKNKDNKQRYYVVVLYHNDEVRRQDCKDRSELRHYYNVLYSWAQKKYPFASLKDRAPKKNWRCVRVISFPPTMKNRLMCIWLTSKPK